MADVNFTSDELDLIEQVVQNQQLIFEDSDQKGKDLSGFDIGGSQISVAQYSRMVSSIVGKLHGVCGTSETERCPDCGEEGEKRGHYGCQYPSDDPNTEGLDDPTMRER